MASTIYLDSVTKQYSGDEILTNITAEFFSNNTYAISGVSGSGKSTLLHILGGFDAPTSGQVLFNNLNLHSLNDEQKSEVTKNLGFVFQFHYLINELTVLENISIVGKINKLDDQAAKLRSEELLSFLGLSHRKNHFPYQLSGGEKQRVAIARAIFNKPDFILADEPTGSLDFENAKLIVDLLIKCSRQWGMGIILSSHDKYVCESMSNVLTLEKGCLHPCKRLQKR